MSKKSKKQATQGTYALCITSGLILGVGLGPVFGALLVTTIIGGLLGGLAGYFFTHLKNRSKHK